MDSLGPFSIDALRDMAKKLAHKWPRAANVHVLRADDPTALDGLLKGDPTIIDLLNEILTGELTAVNQYFLHAKMCQNWGYKRLYEYIPFVPRPPNEVSAPPAGMPR